MKNIFLAILLGLSFASIQSAYADADVEETTTTTEEVAEVSEEATIDEEAVAETEAE